MAAESGEQQDAKTNEGTGGQEGGQTQEGQTSQEGQQESELDKAIARLLSEPAEGESKQEEEAPDKDDLTDIKKLLVAQHQSNKDLQELVKKQGEQIRVLEANGDNKPAAPAFSPNNFGGGKGSL